MVSKEIKFNLRLAIDGKEYWVSAATTAKLWRTIRDWLLLKHTL